MKAIVTLSLSLILLFTACDKGSEQPKVTCAPKMCTLNFASINIEFSSINYSMFTVKNVSAINQRTGLSLNIAPINNSNNLTYMIANDSMLSQFSGEGDNVLISATHSVTNQTKTAVVNISGGCGCHVYKNSGPSAIIFD